MRRIVLLAVLALSACGGSQPKGGKEGAATKKAPAPPADALACRLVTLEEVRQITSLQLSAGEKTPDYLGYSRCEWDPPAGPKSAVQLVVNESGNFQDYSNVPGATPEKGLGLEAVWNGRVRQLAVRREKGTLSVSFLDDPAKREWAEKIAKAALERLQTPDTSAR